MTIPHIEQSFSAALSKIQPGDRHNWHNGFQVQGESYYCGTEAACGTSH